MRNSKVFKEAELTPEIRRMIAEDLGVDEEEIRRVDYLQPNSDDEHFLISVEFFSRQPRWMEGLLDSPPRLRNFVKLSRPCGTTCRWHEAIAA